MSPNPTFPNPAFINDLVNKLGEVLKQSPARDIEQNLKAGVTSMLGKLDMVSREEFDVQTEVLARTREPGTATGPGRRAAASVKWDQLRLPSC